MKTTKDIKVPKLLINQVIGQDEAVEIIKKAAEQRRNVLLIGEPGTGKSMIGQALSELLPKERLKDILVFPNPKDENNPKIKVVKAGEGKRIIESMRTKALTMTNQNKQWLYFLIFLAAINIIMYLFDFIGKGEPSPILQATDRLIGALFVIGIIAILSLFYLGYKLQKGRTKFLLPKLLIDNSNREKAPFVDATGLHEGALLGDVLHDPFQCIPGNEIVHLPNGTPIKIKEIIDPIFEKNNKKEGEIKLSNPIKILGGIDRDYGYTTSNANRVFRRKYNGNLIQIKTRRGLVIRVTPNHPLAVLNKEGDIIYIRADKLSNKMPLVLPEKLPITVGEKLNKKFILLLADILTDGHVSNRSVSFKLKKEFKIKNIIKDIKENGFIPKINKYGLNTIISINSIDFVSKLKSMGLILNGKRIPSIIFDQPKELIIEFLIRYLSLDGYVGKQGQFELISKELIPYLIPLFLKIGIIANKRDRSDPGFGKGKLQPRVTFSNYNFAKEYFNKTINPKHKLNLVKYFKKRKTTHVSYHDIIPLGFSILEKIRLRTGLSKNEIHKEYFALANGLSSTKSLTKYMLRVVVSTFKEYTNCPELFKIERISNGTYSYDEIIELKKINYDGYVYNFTTDTRNYLVNNILTHNSGGLGTPPHERVIPGAIHKANGGVLFVDEIATLKPEMQVEILTAMQEKKYPITGRSERSAGAMVKTDPVPCDFILVAAGNLNTIQNIHPALRSRIRGNGYEVYMKNMMEDTPENRKKLVQFIAQEIKKDGKIPHFTMKAVDEIIKEARMRSGRRGYLTLKLRDLGGLIRIAGDIAKERNAKYVEPRDIKEAKNYSATIENQISKRYTKIKKEYQIIKNSGFEVGRINGLAVIGDSGIVLPIEASVVPAMKKGAGKMIATGKLGEIAKEAILNVSAIIKKIYPKELSNYDTHIQFLQTYEGVEGDSASISVATAVVSSLFDVPINQSIAMTGSLSVKGEVLPVGAINEKIKAARESGIKKVIIPKSNEKDVMVTGIKIIPVSNIGEVLEHAIKWGRKKKILNKIKKAVNENF